MSISGIGSKQSLIAQLGFLDIDAADDAGETAQASSLSRLGFGLTGTGAGGASQAVISQTASLMGVLDRIQKDDPEGFKEIAEGVAEDLRLMAEEGGGDAMRTYALNAMAGQFSNAAMTGGLASLAPGRSEGNRAPRGYGLSRAPSIFSLATGSGGDEELNAAVNAILSGNIRSVLAAASED